MDLFPQALVIGTFESVRPWGLEFHAELSVPHQEAFSSVPIHGRFVVVDLGGDREAVLGRIAGIASVAGAGPQAARQRVDIRMLGVVRVRDGVPIFAPSHRRFPRMGARVAFLSDELLRRMAGGTRGAQIGSYALGEFVYCGTPAPPDAPAWMRPMQPDVPVRFAAEQLVARRSFVFARAGFGKSNLVKLLFAGLYTQRPSVPLRDGRRVPVGTIVFDPDGEYFWPDAAGRPALCDVPELAQQVVVFTNQEPPSDCYGSFRAAGVRLDIRQLPAWLVVSIALSPEQQQQQNVHKLRALDMDAWRQLVELIDRERLNASDGDIAGCSACAGTRKWSCMPRAPT